MLSLRSSHLYRLWGLSGGKMPYSNWLVSSSACCFPQYIKPNRSIAARQRRYYANLDSWDIPVPREQGGGRLPGDQWGGSNSSWDQPRIRKARGPSNPQPFEKNFYKEHPNMQDFTDDQALQYQTTHQILVEGTNQVKPVRTIEEAGFPAGVQKLMNRVGIAEPMPIQSQCWPMVLSGLDMVGIAQTGSGKTLSYLLPAMVHAAAQPPVERQEGPICLVMAPTRELTRQILDVAQQYCNYFRTRCTAAYGGAGRGNQRRIITQGVELLVATPGRLNDFLDANDTNMDRCTFLVLDEADRMLDMGFEPQIRQIVNLIRKDRQTVMWSATWPVEVRGLAQTLLTDPCQVNIGSRNLLANCNITQVVEVCTRADKIERLRQCLKTSFEQSRNKVLIFANTKRDVDYLTSVLIKNGIRATSIHGDRSQLERDTAMHAFGSGRTNILVATDVAARGLDVKDVSMVVNYDFPNSGLEDYVHRIGRTGRAGKKGIAHTLFDADENAAMAAKLVDLLRKADQEIPDDLRILAGQFGGNRHGNTRGRRWGGSGGGSGGGGFKGRRKY